LLFVVIAFAGLVPSAVLNVEFAAGRGNSRSQGSASGVAVTSAGVGSGDGEIESWPTWIIRLGLTVIMLPFRAVGLLFGQPQRYEPLPQVPAAAASAGASVGRSTAQTGTRRERQVEFYNGQYSSLALELLLHLNRAAGGAETGSGTVVTAPPEDQGQ
jgi:hypothetical protein